MSGGKVKPRMLNGASEEMWSGRFRLIDRDTGLPISGFKVRVISSSGNNACDTTDEEGYTRWVSCAPAGVLRIIKDEGELS